MDLRTELLISLGASAAANCIPCFDYYFRKAKSAGITMDEVKTTVEIACKVKTGVGIFMQSSIRDITGQEWDAEREESAKPNHPCCR